jgi:hypothetical protein
MPSKLSGIRSTLALLTLIPLLSGCVLGDLLGLLRSSDTVTSIVLVCPKLSDPPAAAIDALAGAKDDPEVAAWIVDLDRHYQKQDTCEETD